MKKIFLLMIISICFIFSGCYVQDIDVEPEEKDKVCFQFEIQEEDTFEYIGCEGQNEKIIKKYENQSLLKIGNIYGYRYSGSIIAYENNSKIVCECSGTMFMYEPHNSTETNTCESYGKYFPKDDDILLECLNQ